MSVNTDCWLWKGVCLEVPPEGYYGFVYLITNVRDGRIYVGKKCFTYSRKTRLSKKGRQGTKKRTAVKVVDSKWLAYYGSSKELHLDITKLGKESFRREVLHFCKNKSQLTYKELEEQVLRKVLFTDSYNAWIGAKVWKRNLCE